MNGYKKEEVKRDMCKSHSARSERELYRVCPSKLSKKELEDLYFTLLESNLELKKTVTGQQEQIKVLSTRVQRMTATQKNNVAREKDCCVYTKAMVNEQKESIADLKRANERLSERIRVLNMRLCSAKQFLRRSPATSTTRCSKCFPTMSMKNSSVSVLNAKLSDSNMKPAVSSQCLDKDVMLSTRTVETETEEPEKEDGDKLCNENRCRSLMEELKQKIVDLQEELSKTHNDYSTRIARLEEEVGELRSANERERVRRASSEHQLQARGQQADQLAARLRDAEAKYGELSTELSIEKRKVAELETRVKAADRASAVTKTIQEHLTTSNQMKNEVETTQLEPSGSSFTSPRWDKSSPRLEVPCDTPVQPSEATDKPTSDKDEYTEKEQQHRLSKLSNDSGYIEVRSPDRFEEKRKDSNEELQNRIAHLQEQMELLLIAMKTTTVPSASTTGDRFPADSRQLAVPTINISTTPVGDSHDTTFESESPSASVLKAPSAFLARGERGERGERASSKDVTSFPDTDERAGARQAGGRAERGARVSASPSVNTTLHKRMEIQAQSVHAEINKAVRESFLSKDVIEIPSDLADDSKSSTKTDTHNSLQIPGPMPVGDPGVASKFIDKFKKKIQSKNEKKNGKDSGKQAKELNKNTALKEDKIEPKTKTLEINDQTLEYNDAGVESNAKVILGDSRDYETVSTKAPIAPSCSLMEKYVETDVDRIATSSTIIPVNTELEENKIELCLQHARVCTCGGARRRDVSVFRTCSGTLRFRTTPAAATASAADAPVFKHCACVTNATGGEDSDTCDYGTQTEAEAATRAEPFRERSATYSKGHTYPVPAHSPDNTDCEISSLTDLPSEKDGKSPRDALSPGEDRPTTTYTESYTPHTTTDYSELSEGELPVAGGARKLLSEGEAKVSPRDNKQSPAPAQRMEEALAAITEELALCRDLLHSRRPSEPKPLCKDASLMVDLCPGPIALKRAAGTPRIGDTFTPKCIFTLHIGTVVLSDEAVINSRDMSLVLTWKFYDQSLAMTRMRAGRVMLFDFSTEYDVKITDHFLNYLKYENMQIIISELDRQDEPFASCALPLRDALLHTNRRADMSLALVAGPTLRQTRDALDSGDEVGVLDLWCMLRVDPALLPAINRAIARPSPPSQSTAGGPSLIEQVLSDERYTEERISRDLDIRPKQKSQLDFDLPGYQKQGPDLYELNPPKALACKQRNDLVEVSRPADLPERVRSVMSQSHSQMTIDSQPLPQSNRVRTSFQRSQVGFKDPDSNYSRIIANEVPAKIKSAYDMKQALDRNAIDENIPPISRLGKMEEDTASQTYSTASSWRGFMSRRQIPKPVRRSSLSKKDFSVTSLLKKSSDMPSKGVQATRRVSEEVEEPPELTKTSRVYSNSKKSVTIASHNDNSREKENKKLCKLSRYDRDESDERVSQSIEITIMWLALNEECEAMVNPSVKRLYVAYSFLEQNGADLETPVSLPKPKSYVDKCFFQFSKKFQLSDCDLPLLGHMAKCRSKNRTTHSPKDCVVFTVISEPPEDPLGLDNCEDIGYAYLYFGDLLAYSAGSDSYIEVVPIQSAQAGETVCGVLAVKVDGLDVLRRCTTLSGSQKDLAADLKSQSKIN